MGTLVGHIAPGLTFTLLGLWHTLNTITAYKRAGPHGFTSRPWFPLPTAIPALRPLELHAILFFSVLSISLQALDGGFDGLEHATIFLHLAIYASTALACEIISPSPPEAFTGLLGVLAASVFAQELFLLRFHSADHAGLEGHYHWLLQLLVAASLISTIASVGFPASFPAALVRSVSVTSQGLWFIDMGFALWSSMFVPKNCFATTESGQSAIKCGSEDSSRRATALANLQFSWMIAGVSVVTAIACLWPVRGLTGYRQLRRHQAVDLCQVSDGGGGGLKGDSTISVECNIPIVEC